MTVERRIGETVRQGRRQGRRWNTIGAHLVALVVIPIVLLAGTIAFGAREDFRKAEAHAEAQVATMADLATQFVVEERESVVDSLGDLPMILESLSVSELCKLVAESEEKPTVRWFYSAAYLLRTDGSAACPQDASQPKVADEAWFKAALRSDEPVSDGPLVDPITQKRTMIDAFAVDGLVLAYSTELDSVGPSLDYQFGKGSPAPRFTITSSDRSSEVASSGKTTGRDTSGTAFARSMTTDTFVDLDGIERIYAERKVPGEGWHLYAGISTADAFAGARESLRERVFLGVVFVLLVLAAAAVIARRFARPIRALAKVTRRISQEGELELGVTPSGPAELRELGEAYNEMIAVREAAEAALLQAYRAERRAAEDEREVGEMRQAFLRAISHELRTPLTSVVGYSTFLNEAMDDLPPEEVKMSIGAIASQSKRLERLLLDLLDTERLERGIVEPSLANTDVTKLVMRVIEQSTRVDRIRTEFDGPVHAVVDSALVERMVENLVFNAIKHTPDDSKIWVRASRVNGELHLSVEDSGQGVPDELKTAIFEPFKQGAVQSHAPGTGVGLNLVSQFAKLHGGRAWVEDREGGGSAFRIELPAENGNARTSPGLEN